MSTSRHRDRARGAGPHPATPHHACGSYIQPPGSHLATSTDHPRQQVWTLGRVASKYPDPAYRVPPASSGLHPLLHVSLPPVDPQCHTPGRNAPDPGAGRPRFKALCFAFPRPPLDDQLESGPGFSVFTVRMRFLKSSQGLQRRSARRLYTIRGFLTTSSSSPPSRAVREHP